MWIVSSLIVSKMVVFKSSFSAIQKQIKATLHPTPIFIYSDFHSQQMGVIKWILLQSLQEEYNPAKNPFSPVGFISASVLQNFRVINLCCLKQTKLPIHSYNSRSSETAIPRIVVYITIRVLPFPPPEMGWMQTIKRKNLV